MGVQPAWLRAGACIRIPISVWSGVDCAARSGVSVAESDAQPSRRGTCMQGVAVGQRAALRNMTAWRTGPPEA
jgi:hypothetical protein